MIRIHDLTFRVPKKTILEHIGLTVNAGDFWLIFGPNGAGKTTLLKIMCGLLHDFEGTVTIAGKNAQKTPVKEMAKFLSYQPQFDEFSLPLKVKEILMAGRYPYKSFFRDYGVDDYNIYHDVVKRLNLEPFVDRDINTLSGGERKKVMLASAFIQDVSMVLFDEPFTFLDPEAVSNLKKMMVEMNRMGKTLVVVSHHFEALFPIVNKVMALKDGKIVYSGNKVFDVDVLKETYNTEFGRILHKGREIIYLND